MLPETYSTSGSPFIKCILAKDYFPFLNSFWPSPGFKEAKISCAVERHAGAER
jgi:hypothetical protein